MSSAYSPLESLQRLTLDPPMSPTAEEVRARALPMRDVLSSFSRDEFPSEYRPDIFANLDRPLVARPQQQSEWTIQADLEGTILQWAVYDEQAYSFIKRIQPPSFLARCFHEKLSRRFDSIFQEYDDLSESGSNIQEALAEVKRLAVDFRVIVLAVQEDRRNRELGQQETVRLSLGAMIGVCQRHTNIAISSPTSQRSSRRTAITTPDNVSFLDVTTQVQLEEESGLFLMLEVLSNYPAEILSSVRSELQTLSEVLRDYHAPATYAARADNLLRRATITRRASSPGDPESTAASTTAGPSVKPIASDPPAATTLQESVIEAEPESSTRTGTKRQATQQGGAKRGRKKPTHGG